ncbi:glycosyltransferase family 4 protein [Candidatus Peregrinibacteria bacterium CG10_big_fil_rev_8_21_14_0_10_42_8]|nr:MAG: glycosyltransferase family 4 protein [Candidatus Peregrinibacteria bacterium CG10_big_fil_rev_8_21_14_0_10_42_8]
MQLAIVADWLPVFAGAEHVIAEFHVMWPDAPIFTTVTNRENIGPLKHADIRTTYLQTPYCLSGKHQWLLPWMPRAIESINLHGYDTILSSSHAIGKGIIPPSTARHICYCHTPMRYAWEMEEEYLDDFKIPQFLRRAIKQKLKQIRRWDMTSAMRVDTFIANSTTTQERIARVYNRDSIVIHPPVSERFFRVETSRRDVSTEKPYYLAIGRLVPYKRFDLLIETANKLKLPLKIAGSGQEGARLKAMAGPTVEMLGFVPDNDLPELYRNARALLFPQFEDAGVVPLEAQASGTPVIAFRKGGVLDTIKNGETGLYFNEQSIDSLSDAIRQCETMTFNSSAVSRFAAQFSANRFKEKMNNVISCL